jgi:hypothetical protein
MQILKGVAKSHEIPFNLVFTSISTNQDGATESLALYK